MRLVLAFVRTLWRRTRDLWRRAKSERAAPKEIAWAIALGVFCGCTPAVGLRPLLAVALSTAFRLNRLFAFIGAHIASNWLTFPWVILLEIQVAHRIRSGAYVALDMRDLLHQASALLVDWLLGALLIGTGAAALAWLLAFGATHWRAARRKVPEGDGLTPHTPDGHPPRISESPQ